MDELVWALASITVAMLGYAFWNDSQKEAKRKELIKKVQELRDAGVISEREFQEQKTRVDKLIEAEKENW